MFGMEQVRYRVAWLRWDPSDEALRMTRLRILLRLVSVGYLVAFIPWITLILLGAPILAPGGRLASTLRFQPYNADYESMLAAISIVWAVMLWRASYNPAEHSLFIDFTIWATAAHGLVMIIATPIQKGLVMTFIEAIPLFVLAAMLWWLRPRVVSPTAPAIRKPQEHESIPTGRVANAEGARPHGRTSWAASPVRRPFPGVRSNGRAAGGGGVSYPGRKVPPTSVGSETRGESKHP